jgi:hypothetical protein
MTIATYVPQKVIERAKTIAWTVALGMVTPEALAVREQLSTAAAKDRLDEATGLGLLERHSVLVGYPDLYTTTFAGRGLARKYADAGGYVFPQGLSAARVTIREARHTIACVSVLAALERRYPGHRIIGERELYRDEREQERRLASVEIRRQGAVRSKYPDIVVWPPVSPGEPPGSPILVEVELTLKSTEYLRTVFRAVARSRLVQGVLYYVETTRVEERLLDVIEECGVQGLIAVNPLSEIVSSLPGFELSPGETED